MARAPRAVKIARPPCSLAIRATRREAGGAFPRWGRRQHGSFSQGAADDLEADGQVGLRETAGDRDCGHSRKARRRRVGATAEEAPPGLLLALDRSGVEADGRRREWRRGCEEKIELPER